MAHCTVPEAEALLDQEFKVLNHGFVRLVDYLGGDDRIVQSARVSYGAGTKSVRRDEMLIDYLLGHEHTSPFEHVVLEIHAKMPLFVARQWVRHRTARINEISGRYSIMESEFYLPPKEQILGQSADNKQGRDPHSVPQELQEKVLNLLKQEQDQIYGNYTGMLDDGIARELARVNLPLSLYTQWYWQIDLHNLFHFLRLRMDAHAQWEIRVYAEAMAKLAQAVAPKAWKAFEKHSLKGIRFSASELAALQGMIKGDNDPAEHLGKLEKLEFDQKLEKMNELADKQG